MPRVVIDEPFGPQTLTKKDASKVHGNLVVFSGWDIDNDPERQKHTGYSIRTIDGNLIQSVRNQTGVFDSDPDIVDLEEGEYRIEAFATNLGIVNFKVVIRGLRTTVVYLDGTTPPGVQPSDENLIKLPNGQIAGWRASRNSKIHAQ